MKIPGPKRGRKCFPLYNERQVYDFNNKKAFKLIEDNLIDHKHDDDCDTDEEIVNDHIDLCMQQLKTSIEEFLKGEPLRLIRNLREHYSGIERIDCNEEEDINSTPDSSWYEMCSTVNNKRGDDRDF